MAWKDRYKYLGVKTGANYLPDLEKLGGGGGGGDPDRGCVQPLQDQTGSPTGPGPKHPTSFPFVAPG